MTKEVEDRNLFNVINVGEEVVVNVENAVNIKLDEKITKRIDEISRMVINNFGNLGRVVVDNVMVDLADKINIQSMFIAEKVEKKLQTWEVDTKQMVTEMNVANFKELVNKHFDDVDNAIVEKEI